jgi:3-hydroxyacyl-[acyl-carrier-protein] dehydratase
VTELLNREQILQRIPHRPPFLWIDSVLELEAGMRCVAAKFVNSEEPILAGHFPGNAILPGVLIIEAAAQTAAVMLGAVQQADSVPSKEQQAAIPLLAAVNRFRFLHPVPPGSEMRIEAIKEAEYGSLASVKIRVWVGEREVAGGSLFVSFSNPHPQKDTGENDGNTGGG